MKTTLELPDDLVRAVDLLGWENLNEFKRPKIDR